MKKVLLIVIGITVTAALVVFIWHHHGPGGTKTRNAVNSFKECASAGNPVGESYPRQCWTPNGRYFVEVISPAPGQINVTGEIACLPKIGSGPQTLECAIGVKDLDGRYYSLKNLNKLDPEYEFSISGLKVEVSGIFNPEETKGPDGNKYDVVGVIDVTSIKEIKD